MLELFDKLANLDFGIIHVSRISNTIADGISIMNESVSFSELSAQNLPRDSIESTGNKKNDLLIEKAHLFDQLGQHAVYMRLWADGWL